MFLLRLFKTKNFLMCKMTHFHVSVLFSRTNTHRCRSRDPNRTKWRRKSKFNYHKCSTLEFIFYYIFLWYAVESRLFFSGVIQRIRLIQLSQPTMQHTFTDKTFGMCRNEQIDRIRRSILRADALNYCKRQTHLSIDVLFLLLIGF